MSHVCLINRHLSLSVSCSSFLTVPSQLHQSGFIYSMNKDGSGKPKSWLQIVHSEIVGRNHRHYIHVFLLSLIKTTNLLVKRKISNIKSFMELNVHSLFTLCAEASVALSFPCMATFNE